MVLRRRPYRYALAIVTCLVALGAADPANAAPVPPGPAVHPVLPNQGSKPPAEIAAVPPRAPVGNPKDTIVIAGVTGFLHHRDASPEFLWTRYDTGATTVESDFAGLIDGAILPAGDDWIYTTAQLASYPAPGKAIVINLADGAVQERTIPTGYQLRAVYLSSTMLVSGTQNGAQVLQLLTFAADGTSTTRTVSGIPAGATVGFAEPLATNGTAGVVTYRAAGVLYHALLDVASGAAVTLPLSNSASDRFLLSSSSIAWYTGGVPGPVHVFSISGLTSGTDMTSREVAVPAGALRIVLVGDHFVASADGTADAPAVDLPISGGGGGTVLAAVAQGNGTLVQAPDGSALAVGGSKFSDWAVHRFSTGSGGSLADRVVLALRVPLSGAGLSLSHGLLRQLQSAQYGGDTKYLLQNYSLDPDSSAISAKDDGGTLADTADACAGGVHCVRMVDGNWYGVVYLGTSATGQIEVHAQIDAYTSTVNMPLNASGGRLVDVSPSYVIVNATSPATQYVIDLGHLQVVRSGPVTGAALWYSTLWTATTTPGQLVAVNLVSGATNQTISTGASCVPSEVQATGRWLYWSCGAGKPAGVLDLNGNGGGVTLPVITGPVMLGDGYLAWHDLGAGALEMFDFHNAHPLPTGFTVPGKPLSAPPPTPTKLASLAAGAVPDDRGIDWTVDKYGGDVAYLTVNGVAHVVDTGVPPSPTALGDAYLQTSVSPGSTVNIFNADYQITRPVASWTVTITRNIGGQAVFKASGGAARTEIRTGWNGLLASGAKAISGQYTWTLAVVPAGGGTPQTVRTGLLAVYCGQQPYRSLDCEGTPAFLAVERGGIGEAHWYEGLPNGGLRDNGYTETWPLGTGGAWEFDAIVPFGDINGDGLPDILARDGTGVLHAYLGFGETYFNRQSVRDTVVGTGWGGYTLAATGDVNRDGRADLLARDSAGQLWLYPGTGTGSLGSRVLVGTGWNGFTRLIGAGDLNGDGVGDLLAVDSSGTLWRYNGSGTGGWIAGVRVGTGWGGYNAIIGIGDLSADGNNDLVARDSAGNLWEYRGNGAGGFAPATLAGSGFQVYQALF